MTTGCFIIQNRDGVNKIEFNGGENVKSELPVSKEHLRSEIYKDEHYIVSHKAQVDAAMLTKRSLEEEEEEEQE